MVITDDVQASFIDVTDIKDGKNHIRAVSSNDEHNSGSVIVVNTVTTSQIGYYTRRRSIKFR